MGVDQCWCSDTIQSSRALGYSAIQAANPCRHCYGRHMADSGLEQPDTRQERSRALIRRRAVSADHGKRT